MFRQPSDGAKAAPKMSVPATYLTVKVAVAWAVTEPDVPVNVMS
jgi:hypothetical protein